MAQEPLFQASARPDLEEFLSALNGFLAQPSTSTDPGVLRFLEIFFRSVKSNKGHLLRLSPEGSLYSVSSYGIAEEFNDDFNSAHDKAESEPCPLDIAFREKDAVAVVDMSRDPDTPPWFHKIMKKYGFVSLVAIPLMGADQPVGILCAYYNDVCLFDRTTLNHLLMIGRMVGGATEQNIAVSRAVTHGEKEKSADQFLTLLTSKNYSKVQVYHLLSRMASETFEVDGLLCGPVKENKNGLVMTAAAGIGVPPTILSDPFPLPDFIEKDLTGGSASDLNQARSAKDWGSIKPHVKSPVSASLSCGLIWRNNVLGAVVAWRAGRRFFDEDDQLVLRRLSGIATLALQAQ